MANADIDIEDASNPQENKLQDREMETFEQEPTTTQA